MRIPYSDICKMLYTILIGKGMDEVDARLSSRLFADASRDGVYTHGLNRFPLFVSYIDRGFVDVKAKAECESRIGIVERWNGNNGPGNLNAYRAMERAIGLSHDNAIGVVALRNNNHWMRAGNYGLEAAENGCIGLTWTNAMPNMPAWGAKDARIGNNPLVISIPYKDTPVLVDIAMSMFSYGKLEQYSMEGKECPVDGGFDDEGRLTRNPDAIRKTRELLPMGYWKGSSLAIALDLVVSLVSGGRTTRDIGELEVETGVSQFFMAIDLSLFPDKPQMESKIERTLSFIDSSKPRNEGICVHYPGEGMKRIREESMRSGVYVADSVWAKIEALL